MTKPADDQTDVVPIVVGGLILLGGIAAIAVARALTGSSECSECSPKHPEPPKANHVANHTTDNDDDYACSQCGTTGVMLSGYLCAVCDGDDDD